MPAKAATIESLVGEDVSVAGHTVHIGRLSLSQWIGIARAAGRMKGNVSAESAKEAAAKAAAKGEGDIEFLISLLDERVILGLYSAVTGIDESELERSFSMAEFINVIAALKSSGELPEVIAAFTKVVEGW